MNKILIIDDDITQARYVGHILESALECSCECRQSLSAARKDSELDDYDLIVTDLVMPDIDGLALIAEVKALSPSSEVVVLTAYPEIGSVIQAMKIGAADYLGRTGGQDEWIDRLVDSVQSVLDIRPSSRSPGYHRENLIHFLFDRLSCNLKTSPHAISQGQLLPGMALEYLIKLLLESCDGFGTTFHRSRNENEEHDLICVNNVSNPFWKRQGSIILVECKDLTKSKPGDKERGRLEQKIQNRHGQATVGFFASTSGFAKTFKRPLSRISVPGGAPPIIIPLDKDSIIRWIAAYDRLGWITDLAITSL